MAALPPNAASAAGSFAGALRRVGGRFGPSVRIWSFAAVLAALTAALLGWSVLWERSPFETVLVAVPAVAVLYFCAERFPVHLIVRRETHTFSLTEIPLVIGLFFVTPASIVLAQTLGSAVALLVHRRQPPVKLAFNLANFALGTTCAIVVFHAVLGSSDALGPMGWLAAFAATFTADQMTGLGVAIVIWLTAGEPPELEELVGIGTLYTFIDTSLALVAVIVLATHPEAAWLLVVLAATTLLGFRLYQDERVKRESLGSLQESTRRIQESLRPEDVARMLLGQVRSMFNARVAELIILPGGSFPATTTRLGDGDAMTFQPTAPLDPAEGMYAMVEAQSSGRKIGRRSVDPGWQRWLDDRGLADAMIVPVRDGEAIQGLLIAGDRMGNAGTFTAEHLSLFETLANHAGVAMKNGYLVDRLRAEAELNLHRARHDSLTELPNRALFRQRLGEALAAGCRCAVLMLDVDRFKEINDTLGHQNGDVVLKALALRLVESLDGVELVARLSGDEYAVLLAQPPTDEAPVEARAVEVARAIGTAFESLPETT